MKVNSKVFFIIRLLDNYNEAKDKLIKYRKDYDIDSLLGNYNKAIEKLKKEGIFINSGELTELIIRIVVDIFNLPRRYNNLFTFYPSWLEQALTINRIENFYDEDDIESHADLYENLNKNSYIYKSLIDAISKDDTFDITDRESKLLNKYNIPTFSKKSKQESPKGFKFCSTKRKDQLIQEALNKKMIKNKTEGLKMTKDKLCKLLGYIPGKPKAKKKTKEPKTKVYCEDYTKEELLNKLGKKTKKELCDFLNLKNKPKSSPKKPKASKPKKAKSSPKKPKKKAKTPLKSCPELMGGLGIKNKKEFRKWAVKGGHPDKGGNKSLFQQVNNCVGKEMYG